MTEWHRVVFSDESRFCLSSDSRRVRVWRRRGERSNPAAIVERPTVRQRGIMVWGAIAYDSRSPLLRIQGTMTAQRYVDVLRPVTLPYLQGVPNALYQQDNARPHTARISQQALQDVQMLPWPPYSPEISPIEHVWDIIGRRLHALPQPRSEDELWQMVEREWRAIPQDAIRTLIDSLPRRVAACITVRGHRKRRQFKQTDAFTRGMVIELKRAGWSIRQIAADTHLGASTVHRLWRRWLEQGNVTIYRNVGATRVTSARVDRRILRQAVAAPQATCTAILQHVQDTLDHSISTRTISRRLVANGLHSCRPLRRLPLTPPNRRQRLEWCRARSTWMTEWHRVVFSDESRFCLSSDSRRVRVWRRRGERSNPAAIVERPTVRQRGIMVWGAIAYDSRSPLLRIQGTMTAQRYVDNVLRPVTLPYLQGVPNALYQQDNARPHTARISQQALQDVQMLPWPPYSPDLSPIEHVWDIIGRRLHALPQPRSEDELWQMVEREWRAIPQDAIRTLIDSLPRRVAACIAVRGVKSGDIGGHWYIKWRLINEFHRTFPSAIVWHRGKYEKSKTGISSYATASGVTAASGAAARARDEKSTTRTQFNLLQLNINDNLTIKIDFIDILVNIYTPSRVKKYSQSSLEVEIHIRRSPLRGRLDLISSYKAALKSNNPFRETKLNQNLRFNIKYYTTLRKDRPGKFGGGLAVLIKTLEIKFKEIAYNQSKPREITTETQSIEIYLTDKTIPIINVYHHDNTSITTGLIETLSEASSDIAIILGQQVEDMLTDLDLTPLNNEKNTYLFKSTGTESAIDITAINYNIAPTTQWKILKKKLQELCNEELNHRTIDKNLEKFSSNISKAAKVSIPRGRRKDLRRNYNIPYKDFISDLEAIQKSNTIITQIIHSLLTKLISLENNCILKWIPASVWIEGNEMAVEFAKEARNVVMKSNREFENRAAIIVALRAGRSPKEIVDFLKLPKTTIYRVKKQFDEADSNKEGIATRKKHSRRSDRIRGEEFVKNVKEKIDGNPDEKNFDVDQKVNPRNDRWICKDSSEIPVVMHTKFPASVMVLGVISSEGDVMPPHFFEKGLRMNADTYINVLETVVKPWMDMVAAGRKYVFQQDSAPAHKAKKTQSWLTLNVPSHWGPDIWPPNSPDCNPLDYYVWGVVERDVNKAPHTTIQFVKKAVHTVMAQMDKVIVAKACASFRTRLETVVANNGNYIE
ncbi:hypothetical protein LAZ67_6000748 [Cordylochernes scorpioides]|uniref:Transposase n=1 Tax=Cordylochernes scorpioides TaxID=51811 RepID=A0ABY6KIV7_9ARAC|nr:hypothetical protein LAZ67_6000748 [Cordylochernes scorpioides]